jgi:glycosyltransferase involved in cell wall biosynthesis
MRVLFLISDASWSARARAFVLAARGLASRGHDVMLACESECPVQVRAAASSITVVALNPDASAAGDTWQLRRALQEKSTDAVFVHSDEEHLVASSALRLGGGAGAVIRRIPPFAAVKASGFAGRIAPSGFLFSTEADFKAAAQSAQRVAPSYAPLAVDPAEHDAVTPVSKVSLGAPPNSRLVVCVHDGNNKTSVLMALRTLALLAPRHPDLHLAIVGTTRHDEVRMHGASLGVNSMISYVGAREDELSIIRAADVGWIAADGDGAAFAALDFMASRIAVLAPRSPVTEHYVVDGIGGKLLAPADAATTAATVASFLEKNDQRAAMGNAARARLQREFSFDGMIDAYEQAIAAASGRAAQTVA